MPYRIVTAADTLIHRVVNMARVENATTSISCPDI